MSAVRLVLILFSITIPTIGFVYDSNFIEVFDGPNYFGYSVFLRSDGSKGYALLASSPKEKVLKSCFLNKCINVINFNDSRHNFAGATIDGSKLVNSTAIICDSQYVTNSHSTNGICYIRQNKLTKYAPLADGKLQIKRYNESYEYLYAHGQAGFSIKYVENDGYLLGAPGVLSWKGTVIKYTFDLIGDGQLNPEKKIDKWSYLGYSVEFGKFYFRGGLTSCVIAGAPRAEHLHGQVLIFRYDDYPDYLIQVLTGEKTNGYFGYSLLVNGYDILVGAPMHTMKTYDEGCVFVYSSNVIHFYQSQKICGNKIGGRFGHAMIKIGLDPILRTEAIAISAPYEDGNGVVYVYAKMSTYYDLAQRIEGKSVAGGLNGFGFSLSNSVDVDNNKFNDFAVGAYLSGKVIIFKSRPMIKYSGAVTANVSKIRDDIDSIKLKYCFTYSGINNTDEINLEYEIIGDDRVVVPNYDRFLQTFLHKEHCVTTVVYLKPGAHYNPLPIKVKFVNSLKDCFYCPISYRNETSSEIEFPLAVGCGNDEICSPILKVNSTFGKYVNFTIGQDKTIPFTVTVENEGETAYLCKLNVSMDLKFSQIPPACGYHGNLLVCDVSNRFIQNQSKTFHFHIDSDDLNITSKFIKVDLTLYSAGEGNGTSCNTTAVLPVYLRSVLSFSGYSSPEYLLFEEEKEKIHVLHDYIIINEGPSPIQDGLVSITLPSNLSNLNGKYVKIFDIFLVDGDLCANENDLLRGKRGNDLHINEERKFSLNCQNSPLVRCETYICDVNLKVNHSIKFQFGITVNLNFISATYFELLSGKHVVTIESLAEYNHTIMFLVLTILHHPSEESVASWIWILSVILALIVLALISYGLHKIKFFSRPMRERLINEEGEIGHVMLVDSAEDTSEIDDIN